MRAAVQRFWIWLVVLIFGAYQPDLRVVFWRRWAVSFAFRFRWLDRPRLSNVVWRIARLGLGQADQPALSAYASKILMLALMDGRERLDTGSGASN